MRSMLSIARRWVEIHMSAAVVWPNSEFWGKAAFYLP